MNLWQFYGTKTLQVVPYMPGSPAYLDATLPYIYANLRKEGKIADMFCGEDKTQGDFIGYFHRIKTAQIACRVKENKDLDPVGITWVDLPRGEDGARACQSGMAFFGDAARTPDARDLTRLALAYGFEDLRIDVVHGVQLASNMAARNFSQKLGFRDCALVPKWHYVDGRLEAARVMILEKVDFWPAFEEWHAKQKVVEPINSLG